MSGLEGFVSTTSPNSVYNPPVIEEVVRASMFRSDDDARKIGTAVLVAAALVTGFLVATTATGQEYTTVGTASGDQEAYALSVEEDQRLRFQLEDPESHSSATLAIYDPHDEYFSTFQIEADEDAEMIADVSGPWVVFVTQAIDADVAVQAADAEDASVELAPIDVTEETRSVAAQDGESFDEQLTLRISPRPAVAYLAAEGTYEGLDATLSTDEGTVHAIEDARSNQTQDGPQRLSADAVFEPGNLVDGTYTAEASAESFDGQLSIVYKTYDRGDLEPKNTSEVEAPEPQPLENATEVTVAGFHEAHKVPTAGADELVFAVPQNSHAEVFVYNGSDAMHSIVELGQSSYECCSENHSHNESSQEAPLAVESVEAPAEEAVVFVRDLDDDDAEVVVALNGVDSAPAAEELELDHKEIVVDHSENSTASAELDGALVLFEIQPGYDLAIEREVTLTGPLGEIARMHSYGSAEWTGWQDHEVHEDRFSDGEMVLEVQQDSLTDQGETHATLTHYVR